MNNNFSYPQMGGFSTYNASPYMNNYQNQVRFNPMTSQIPVNNNNSNIIWVQGIQGAKALQLPPNNTAIILDSQSQDRGYIKMVDNLGRSTMQTFTYHWDTDKKEQQVPNYVTRQQVVDIIKEYVNEQSVQTNESTTRKPVIIKHD